MKRERSGSSASRRLSAARSNTHLGNIEWGLSYRAPLLLYIRAFHLERCQKCVGALAGAM
jgi:hypothetical protein